MRARFLESYNLINLLKNGGLAMDPGPGEAPPYWDLNGVGITSVEGVDNCGRIDQTAGIAGSNQYALVTGDTPESTNGCTNYYEITLSSDDYVEIVYDFYYRFQEESAGKSVPPWIKDVEENAAIAPYAPIGAGPLGEWDKYYKVTEDFLLRASDITFSMGTRVVSGAVEVTLRYENWPASFAIQDYTLYNSLASEDWVRPVQVHSLNAARVTRLIIRLRRKATGTSKIHLGNFSLVSGGHSFVPFTGDLASEAIPKGAIVFAVGEFCPPGFEKLSFSPPARSGRLFPKSADGNLDEGGTETHDHSDAPISMNPPLDWPTTTLAPAVERDDPTVSTDATMEHTHPFSEAYNVPPSKDIILCKRL